MATLETRLMTAEEFYDWVHRPENRDRFFELERGEMIELPPPGTFHGFVCGNVSRILGNFTVAQQKGYVCTNDSGIIVEMDPDTIRGADISVYDEPGSPELISRQYAAHPPKLIVEVLSPHDRFGKVIRRCMQFLHRGVQAVWLVDPVARDVTVYRQGQEPYSVEENGELTGDDILPGFHCRVAEFFAMPGKSSNQTVPSTSAKLA